MTCPKCEGSGVVEIKGYQVFPRHGQSYFVKPRSGKCQKCGGSGYYSKGQKFLFLAIKWKR